MKALFWKDVRINRLPLIAGLISLVAPYVLVALVPNAGSPTSFWPRVLMSGGSLGFAGFYISMALLGGNVFAAERADRSAEFLAYLPPSKRQILISKGILLFGMATIIIGWNLTAIGVGIFLKSDMEWAGRFYEFLWTLGAVGAFGIAAAGTGWCASSMLSSNGGPVGLGLLVPVVIAIGISVSNMLMGVPSDAWFPQTIWAACSLVGVALFIVGCVYYLRRVEP
ncbi:ABC transporter permease [Symmachiella dynata]|uniref:ABC transporter permease n=1 Tax=Symmachiella dynata TaxID=2527995 RepID=UPI0030EDA462